MGVVSAFSIEHKLHIGFGVFGVMQSPSCFAVGYEPCFPVGSEIVT